MLELVLDAVQFSTSKDTREGKAATQANQNVPFLVSGGSSERRRWPSLRVWTS
jgi:hypothetical protein